jgi:hypothetical protein
MLSLVGSVCPTLNKVPICSRSYERCGVSEGVKDAINSYNLSSPIRIK